MTECFISARTGQVGSLQEIFNTVNQQGEEVQELAREHVKANQLLENRLNSFLLNIFNITKIAIYPFQSLTN